MESNGMISLEIDNLERLSSVLLTFDASHFTDDYTKLESALDEFNSIDFSLKLCSEELSGKIISHLCLVIPHTDVILLNKFCRLIYNLLSRQQLILNSNLEIITEYLIQCVCNPNSDVTNDILRALGAVLYGNGGILEDFHDALLGPRNVLLDVAFSNEDLLRSAVQCIENICIRYSNGPYLTEEKQNECVRVFLKVLQLTKPARMDEIGFAKTLVSALRGVQHILVAAKTSNAEFLGPLLAALKVYMLYGLPNCSTVVPTCLYPMAMSQYDPNPNSNNPRAANKTPKTKNDHAKAKPNTEEQAESGKKYKKKKSGKPEVKDNTANKKTVYDKSSVASANLEGSMANMNVTQGHNKSERVFYDPLAEYPAWSKATSSESEYSDAEGTGSNYNRTRSTNTKVRQTALTCFYALVKATEKKVMFGFWPSFLPDTPGIGAPTQQHTLFTAIMKDPSPRARTGALAVLTALVDGNKQYLMAAEDSAQYRTASFTPFSVRLGFMIKEIHRCLLLCLATEQSNLALTQIIKCIGTFIPNVPYQRLRPGLLTRVIKQIKPFMSHRDPNIRVVFLSCLGSMLAVQAPLLEVAYILNPPDSSQLRPHPTSVSDVDDSVEISEQKPVINLPSAQDEPGCGNLNSSGSNDGAILSGDDNLLKTGTSPSQGMSPLGMQTPVSMPSGIQTPTMVGSSLYTNLGSSEQVSWVIRLCVKNISPYLIHNNPIHEAEELPSKLVAESAPARVRARTEVTQKTVQPLPVRLESLQVLTSMCKGYFNFLRPHLVLIRDVLQCCLEDSDKSVQLHSAKFLDEIGSVLSAKILENHSNVMTAEQVLEFWLPLLNGPIPNALQTTQNIGVRSTLCDCLSNISAAVFEKLPRDKHILVVTLILGMSNDEDRNIQASCVRSLGVLVLYQCLREDVSFMIDAANVIILLMEQTSINVKIKATWSLGNFTDALVMNREHPKEESTFVEEFSDMLLLKLFAVSSKGASDNDKVKANAVRAVGNLLRYLPERCYENTKSSGQIVNTAIKTLIKNSSSGMMKVRWNACYALGNLLKNKTIPFVEVTWMGEVIDTLKAAVEGCKNFKVRINAALALSIPKYRSVYGTSHQYQQIWASLIISIKSSEETTDFQEFKYRDNLIQQVMATLTHLTVILTREDVHSISKVICTDRELLQLHSDKYRQHMCDTTEKKQELEQAEKHLLILAEDEACKNKETVKLLQSLFTTSDSVSSTTAPEAAFTTTTPEEAAFSTTAPQTGFLQTYD